MVGNGFCNDETNNANCHYDNGDCCVVNANTDACSECSCYLVETCAAGYHPLVGNGFCNDNTNIAECDYDSGDCCGNCVNTEHCEYCVCLGMTSGEITNPLVGNSICNDETNNLNCNYDGGDCCGYNINSEHCTECKCFHQQICLAGVTHVFIGDGVCNDETNIAECNYDGGDCCGYNIIFDHCTDCNCQFLSFKQNGSVPLMRDNLATTFYGWGEEYIVSFDFEAFQNHYYYSTVKNVLHLSIGGSYGFYGDRIPAIFTNQLSSSEQVMEFRSSVSGNNDHGFDFSYQLNTPYHIVISQLKNDDIVTYSIQINNVKVHSTVNTDVEVFPAVNLYLSNPWLSTFGGFGSVKNLWVASGNFTGKPFIYFISIELFYKFHNN